MDRTFSYSFDPPSEDPVPGNSVVLSVGDIEEAGIREVLQSPGAALSTWALLDALLEPTGAGTPFQFREPLGQSREVKVALSGLFGRFVARAYLQRYFNSSIFTHLGKTEISLDGRRTLKVRKKIKGDLPDWILCDGAFSSLTVAEAKGCHDQPGPAKALGRAWAQANRIEIIQGGRRATLKRIAIATRWGSKIGGEPDPIISVRDPVEQGDFTEEENQAALIGLSRLHVASLLKSLGYGLLSASLQNLVSTRFAKSSESFAEDAREALGAVELRDIVSGVQPNSAHGLVGGWITRAGPLRDQLLSTLDQETLHRLDLRPSFIGIERWFIEAVINGDIDTLRKKPRRERGEIGSSRTDGVGGWIVRVGAETLIR